MGEFLFLGGASFAFFPVLVLLAVVVVLALRHDDDAGEERAPAIYGSVVAFLALLTLLVAVTALTGVGIQGDRFCAAEEVQAWVDAAGGRYRELRSPHGHDAFLIEHDQVSALLT